MTITEFLIARIAEDEALAKAALVGMHGEHKDRWDWGGYVLGLDRDSTAKQDEFITEWWPKRVLAECVAKRAIIKQHEEWPVLVERKPSELESVAHSLDSITYRMTSELAWLTTREYIKRFGVEPPTAPMISALAAAYRDHPDYQEEWHDTPHAESQPPKGA